MKRAKYSARPRRASLFPILLGCCLLSLLCTAILAAKPPHAAASSLISAGGTASPQEPPVSAARENQDSWMLELVNFSHPLPENHTPKLSPIDENGEEFDSRAAGFLQAMLDDMRAQGLSPLVCSAYRSHEAQQTLFQNQVQGWLDQGYSQEEAEREASLLVARPGTSEHELGLAADIVAESNQLLDESQEFTEEQQWLLSHCQEYGFILRYPPDRSKLTGVSYEPWHYRYVGKEAAQEVMARGICLEEYLGAD